jgi:hypothetical protein
MILKRKVLTTFSMCCIGISLTFGQFQFQYNDSIPVKIGAKTLKHSWVGGLNNVQFSEIDFDFDGDLDLFIFDRSSDNIRLFEQISINGTKEYKFVPNGKLFFPNDLRHRVALVDFNGDGKNDIFTYGVGGVKVYLNTGNQSTGLKWELAKNLLYSNYNGFNSNLYVSSSDIPAYVDVDGDGDIDVLTFNIGGERVEYHQNQSVELYGHRDSLIFVLKNECWGKFKESQSDNSVTLNATSFPCENGNIDNPLIGINDGHEKQTSENETPPKHAGTTLLAIDINNSGVKDLILGDVSHTNLNLLINGGTAPNTNSPMISSDMNFPSNTTPVNLSIFPASFFIDVDFDGKKDLIVGANAKGASQNEKSIHFYKNTGSNEVPHFVFNTTSFLQDEMIEVGTGSIPVLFDQNNDGKEDLIISNFYRYVEPLSKESSFVSFRNTGSLDNPEFTLHDFNYLNLSQQGLGLRMVPTFGDIDGDGDKDLFIGLENGTLVFYENIASPGSPASFFSPMINYADENGAIISTNSYCFPQLFDLNNDGLLDLILGKRTGEIMYYQNVGTSQNPSFSLVTNKLGNINVAEFFSNGYAAPHFFKHNDTLHLFVGAYNGKLHYYNQIEGNISDGQEFNLVSDNFLNIGVEGYSSFFVNDVDNDGFLNLFVGGDLGGIMHFEHNPNSSVWVNETKMIENIEVYPNPSSESFKLKVSENLISKANFNIVNLQGKSILQKQILDAETSFEVSENGIYFLILYSDNQESIGVKKLIKL